MINIDVAAQLRSKAHFMTTVPHQYILDKSFPPVVASGSAVKTLSLDRA